MSYMLQHLHSGWAVDQAIVTEEERLVCIRFGHDYNPECIKMDELLYKIADDVKNFCTIYLVDITEVPDFNGMYELFDPVSVMFFYRNKHMMIDLGTGNNNKINWALNNKQELIDIIETIYRGARKGTAEAKRFWERVGNLEKRELCMNCEKHKWKHKDVQVCADCFKRCESVKCVHCKAEFSYHRYCNKAHKLYYKLVCMRCASNIATYNKDPRLCRFCNAWAAWRDSGDCDRCSSFSNTFGDPNTCESCGNLAAFDRGEASRDKVGGLWLCFLCTYEHKKSDYYIKKRRMPNEASPKDDKVQQLKRANQKYKREIEAKQNLLQKALKDLSQLQESYKKLALEYENATGKKPPEAPQS
ncbi:bifunctional Dim1 family/Thioredoxin-like superfamily/FAM76 protein [Babesia duncani]|uniref:Bifunctional Dim1 family/Thioredoxin-like superfamily/FAM76 protein n=1 Tax=Babesia duncani TaxID=323732 RepID=A0AAD9UNC8_9APIC|nr:bifunctional Dim1 family/Thioredoxin-like superfamily/FAM76 protein [Babesia duncani]